MATADGRERGDLTARLMREPYAFDFFQAVRLLQRLAREPGGEAVAPRRRLAPVGRDAAPELEAVRFRSQPSLSFPASAIADVRPQTRGEAGAQVGQRAGEQEATSPLAPPSSFEMAVTFLGVTGPVGVLPYHYTALLLRRIRERDFSLRDFLDIFHHRAISLFYRAWLKYRLPFAYESARQESADKEDPITSGLYCLTGMGTPGLRGRLDLDDEALLYYSGHFAHFPRSAVVLEGILADYFDLPVRVKQLQGQWLHIAADEQTLMPERGRPKGLNNRLGVDVVVGERVWDVQSKFRLQVGPLSYGQFRQFLPGGAGLKRLRQLSRLYVGPEFDFDVQVLLRRDEVPMAQLGGKQHRLGWDMWSRTRDFIVDADDAVFDQEERSGNS